ncbi:hypothetical protein P9112_006615 [Eukaryota sp. TZLM1-RC]
MEMNPAPTYPIVADDQDPPQFHVDEAGPLEYVLMYFFSILFFPITILGSWYTVETNEEVVVLIFGKLRCVANEGLQFHSIFGRSILRISKRVYSIRHTNIDVVDSTGAMLEVSAAITYQVEDSVTALLNFDDVHDYLKNISLCVLRRIVTQYPYISETDAEPSLKGENALVSARMCELLQEKSQFAGIKTLTFDLIDLQYDPIIASAMLIKQQAHALLGARQLIVKGAVDIIVSSINNLKSQGVDFDEEDKTKLVGNLLSVICSDVGVTPVLNVGVN